MQFFSAFLQYNTKIVKLYTIQAKNHWNISVALDENIYFTDMSWMIIFVLINDDNFNLSEELLRLASLLRTTKVQ
jgi:hypothetical protein